ncbi:MAG: hypothetical protein ACK44D_05215 [Bacteroidia bacterium]
MITVKNNLYKAVIFLSGLLVIFGTYYIIKIQSIKGALITEGIVTTNYMHGINKSDFGSTISAEIQFYANDSLVTILGPEGQPMDVGLIVPVLYQTEMPGDAVVYTFDGFWLHGLIWCILPTIFWVAISLSVVKVKDN